MTRRRSRSTFKQKLRPFDKHSRSDQLQLPLAELPDVLMEYVQVFSLSQVQHFLLICYCNVLFLILSYKNSNSVYTAVSATFHPHKSY